MRLGFAAYLIPYMFVYSTGLLWVGSWDSIALAIVAALIGVTSLAAAIEGWLMGPLNAGFRLALAAGAIALVAPVGLLKLAGAIVIVAVAFLRFVAFQKSSYSTMEPRS